MQNIIFGLISFLIAEFAFGYGAKKLFKKKKTDVSAVSRLCGRMLCDTAAFVYRKYLVPGDGIIPVQQRSCLLRLSTTRSIIRLYRHRISL